MVPGGELIAFLGDKVLFVVWRAHLTVRVDDHERESPGAGASQRGAGDHDDPVVTGGLGERIEPARVGHGRQRAGEHLRRVAGEETLRQQDEGSVLSGGFADQVHCFADIAGEVTGGGAGLGSGDAHGGRRAQGSGRTRRWRGRRGRGSPVGFGAAGAAGIPGADGIPGRVWSGAGRRGRPSRKASASADRSSPV